MLQNIRTNLSDNIVVIDRFDIFLKLSGLMKVCNTFYVSIEDRRMYGFPDDNFAVFYINIPEDILPKKSFFFNNTYYSSAMKEYVYAVQRFVTDSTFSSVMLPYNGYEYIDRINITNKLPLNEWILAENRDDDPYLFAYEYKDMIKIHNSTLYLNGFWQINSVLHYVGSIDGIENEEAVLDVVNNKVTSGRRLLNLIINNRRYEMFIFKGFFSMKKGEKISVSVFDRIDNAGIFFADFKMIKKSPDKELGKTIDVHVATQFIHL